MCTVLFVTLGTLGSGAGAGAATVTWPVSTGADGALALPAGTYTFDTLTGQIKSGSTVLLSGFAPSDAHAWNFTSLTVATDAIIAFQGSNLPDILVSGDASIGGTINLDGGGGAAPTAGVFGSGGGSPTFAGTMGSGAGGAGGAHGQGGAGGGGGQGCSGGGGGGGNGGGGGGAATTCAGGNGGIGGGLGGVAGPNGGRGSDPGTYAGQAGSNGITPGAGGGGGGSIGTAQNDLAVTNNTLYPGSGGGGGGSVGISAGGGGGGGGGVIQVVAGGTLTITGNIIANGGTGGTGFAGGGGGSGGLIELAAPAVTIAGGTTITARGGVGGTATSPSGGGGGQGGLGRIRIAADQLTVNSTGLYPAIGATNGPGLAYVSRWSSAVLFTTAPPSTQSGVKTGAISVALEGNDGNPVQAPAGGMQLSLTSTSATGTFYDASGSAVVTSVTVPAGSSAATFQYADTTVGTPTLTVTPPGGSGLAAATQQVTITAPPLVFKTTSLKIATEGVPYHLQLGASGGEQPYTWSVSSGSPPTGITLTKHGVLGGTPTESGQFTFTAQVQDAQATVADRQFTLTVNPVAPDGAGTLRLTPRTAAVGSIGNTLTFTYHAPSTGALVDGSVQIVVPSGWSPPSVLATDPGAVTASKGTVSVLGMTITVSGVNLAPGAALTLVYGATGGGGPGATAPSSAGSKHFLGFEQSTASGAMTALAKSPSVKVS